MCNDVKNVKCQPSAGMQEATSMTIRSFFLPYYVKLPTQVLAGKHKQARSARFWKLKAQWTSQPRDLGISFVVFLTSNLIA